MAERAGFEPAIRFPVYTLSRRAPSTTRPPLRLQLVRNGAARALLRGALGAVDRRAGLLPGQQAKGKRSTDRREPAEGAPSGKIRWLQVREAIRHRAIRQERRQINLQLTPFPGPAD
jgi:hypothetical protein